MEKRIVKTGPLFSAEIFVVPNCIDTASELYDLNRKNTQLKDWGFQEEIKKGDKAIQVWMVDSESSNWQDHGAPEELHKMFGVKKNYFVNNLPASIFDGKKEGDSILLQLEKEGKTAYLSLTLNQLGFRYRSHGKFEEVMDYVTK